MNKEKCRRIYREAFCDPDTSFEDLLFAKCFDYLKTLEAEGETVSMLFLLPCVLKTENGERNTAYIYAAATDKAKRKKGYMGKLIKSVLEEYDFIFLRPASKPLCDYYGSLGFKAIKTNQNPNAIELVPIGGYKELAEITGLNDNGESFTAMYYSKTNESIEEINFNYSMN